MTRETKVGLVVGLAIILLIGIVVSDHLTVVRDQDLPTLTHLGTIRPPALRDTPSSVRPFEQDERHIPKPGTTSGTPIPNQPQPAPRLDPIPTPQELIGQNRSTPRQRSANANELLASDTGDANSPPDAPQRQKESPQSQDQPVSDQTPKLVSVTERSKRIVHYVKANENLWGIAEHYYGDGAYWRSIVEANPKAVEPNGWVREGVRLLLPNLTGKIGIKTVSTKRASGGRASVPNIGPQSLLKTTIKNSSKHTIFTQIKAISGDTLSQIAAQSLGSTSYWPQLLAANRDQLGRPEDLREGMTIRIPKIVGTSNPAALDQNRPPADSRSGTSIYRVQPNDTLSAISRRVFGSDDRWMEIYSLNRRKLRDADQLPIGMVLILPSDARITDP